MHTHTHTHAHSYLCSNKMLLTLGLTLAVRNDEKGVIQQIGCRNEDATSTMWILTTNNGSNNNDERKTMNAPFSIIQTRQTEL